MRKKDLKRLVKVETKRIYKIGFPKENTPLVVVKIVCFLTKNNRFYRARLLKAWRFYSFYKEKSFLWLFSKFYWFRVYNKYSLLLNTQLGCTSLGEGLVFIHQNVILTRNAIVGKNVTFLGDNCLAAGKYSKKNKSNAPILGDRVWMGYGSIALGGYLLPMIVLLALVRSSPRTLLPRVPLLLAKIELLGMFLTKPIAILG